LTAFPDLSAGEYSADYGTVHAELQPSEKEFRKGDLPNW